jgi:hypothetical protein
MLISSQFLIILVVAALVFSTIVADNAQPWAWVGGNKTVEVAGIYGSLGDTGSFYLPGARASATTWFDGASRQVWLFGGYGVDSTNQKGSSAN